MKKLFLLILMIPIHLCSQTQPKQEGKDEPHHYEFVRDFAVIRYDLLNNKPDTIRVIAYTGIQFEDEGTYEIKTEGKSKPPPPSEAKTKPTPDSNSQTEQTKKVKEEETKKEETKKEEEKKEEKKKEEAKKEEPTKEETARTEEVSNTKKVRVIRFWDYEYDSTIKSRTTPTTYNYNTQHNYREKYDNDSTGRQFYFYMDEGDFKNEEIVRKVFDTGIQNWTVIFGPMITPVKFRFANDNAPSEFSSAVNLGLAAGLKYRMSPYKSSYIVPYISLGISTVSIDSSTSKGFYEQSNQVSSFTFSFGCMYQFNNAQIGLSFGWDFLSGQISQKWAFSKKPWMGIGIGLELFGKSEDKK